MHGYAKGLFDDESASAQQILLLNEKFDIAENKMRFFAKHSWFDSNDSNVVPEYEMTENQEKAPCLAMTSVMSVRCAGRGSLKHQCP